jgi:hypothetical protein
MDAEIAVPSAERSFFSSLIPGDTAVLDALLADDFLLIDVLRGAEASKPALLVFTGRTEMRMLLGRTPPRSAADARTCT